MIEDFFFTLSAELEFLVDKPPYLDRDRLKGGEFYNEALASNLCKSACLVVLYTPVYFSLDHMYCAREYRAMEQIELARQRLLRGFTDGECRQYLHLETCPAS